MKGYVYYIIIDDFEHVIIGLKYCVKASNLTRERDLPTYFGMWPSSYFFLVEVLYKHKKRFLAITKFSTSLRSNALVKSFEWCHVAHATLVLRHAPPGRGYNCSEKIFLKFSVYYNNSDRWQRMSLG